MKSKIIPFVVFLFFLSTYSYGRLGETEQESGQRYGKPVENPADTATPLLKGAVNRSYEYKGWRIREAFLNDLTVRIAYSKLPKPKQAKSINKDEIDAILTAESHGGKWKKGGKLIGFSREALAKSLSQAGMLKWTNSKGYKAHLPLGNLVMFVESPEAEIWEKAIEDEKRGKQKESIPKF